MSAAAVRGEVLKLARLLGRDPETLTYLERLEPDDLVQLREQVTEMLFSAHSGVLGRLATASKLLPVGVIASIAERALGPMLTARIAGMLEPERAVDVAGKLSGPFIADVASELDPRRAGPVIGLIPADQIADITRELVRRREYVTIGRFVGHLSADARLAALVELDAETRAQLVFVVEDEPGLVQLFADVPVQERGELFDAAGRAGLSAELREVVGRLPEPLRSSYLELATTSR
jgi:hypothetical protein